MKYGFHPAAEVEHLEQVTYLEQQQPGLGRRYLAEVEAAIARACTGSVKYPIAQAPDLRRIFVHGFPFTILFREVDGMIRILAVAHYRRRPRYWVGRVR